MEEKQYFLDRLAHSWSVFRGREPTNWRYKQDQGPGYSSSPTRSRLAITNERTIIASIYNRLSMDVASLLFQHVKVDTDGRFVEVVNDGLNQCLTIEANMDQSGREFIQDAVVSMFDEGSIALVPTDTTYNPMVTSSYDIQKMRVGKIIRYYAKTIIVEVYNEDKGFKEQLEVDKREVAIVENPFYAVMNEPNSTLKRLAYKLSLLDAVDNANSSGKLDLIIQLPYTIKTTARQEQAEKRRKDIELQMTGSKYGIAYVDATEKITQLNRPVENTLLAQVEYLTRTLYNQLGMSEAVFDGTADEKTMLNYYNTAIDPTAAAIRDSMIRTFITKQSRTLGHTIMCFRDPFKLVPISQLADIADKFTRNEILSSNEVRSKIGEKPSKQKGADELRNKNINAASQTGKPLPNSDEESDV